MIRILYKDEAVREIEKPGMEPGDVSEVVADILDSVRARGDEALTELGGRFGDPVGHALEVSSAHRSAARDAVPSAIKEVMERAARNIRAFADAVRQSLGPVRLAKDGFSVGLDYRPVARVGCYVPGGRHPLASTALMTAITARSAGVLEVLLVCPDPTPEVLFAADLAGADRIFRTGGAQAVAALAFGTETIPAVDMVVGPGNAYVTEAKRQLAGVVGIDMLAGPSEVAVIADRGANPVWVASDMLAQWEHDPMARAWLFTDDEDLARAVAKALEKRLEKGGVPGFLRRSVDQGAILVFDSLAGCAVASDLCAPEHLVLSVEEPEVWLKSLSNYGAMFLGYGATVPFGDYMAGPNHTLPTGRNARFTGGLSPLTFLRPQGWVKVDDRVEGLARDTARFAQLEGLGLHAEAANLRCESEG
jgi:histidinol dehydrogenase